MPLCRVKPALRGDLDARALPGRIGLGEGRGAGAAGWSGAEPSRPVSGPPLAIPARRVCDAAARAGLRAGGPFPGPRWPSWRTVRASAGRK